MELVDAGENFYAEMKRSTNGGGENSPVKDGMIFMYFFQYRVSSGFSPEVYREIILP